MGLDITAVSRLEHVGKHPTTESYCEDEDHFTAFAYTGFERSMRGLKGSDEPFQGSFVGGHCYRVTDESQSYGFRAGSYSGYGAFRDTLAQLTGHSASEYWNGNVDEDVPFYELINFADNEGTIGPEAAKDLLEDFRAHRDRFAQENSDSYWVETYDDWIKGLELAADGGLVAFH